MPWIVLELGLYGGTKQGGSCGLFLSGIGAGASNITASTAMCASRVLLTVGVTELSHSSLLDNSGAVNNNATRPQELLHSNPKHTQPPVGCCL